MIDVDQILKGEKLADLAVQPPVKHDLVINLKTAKALASICRRRRARYVLRASTAWAMRMLMLSTIRQTIAA